MKIDSRHTSIPNGIQSSIKIDKDQATLKPYQTVIFY